MFMAQVCRTCVYVCATLAFAMGERAERGERAGETPAHSQHTKHFAWLFIICLDVYFWWRRTGQHINTEFRCFPTVVPCSCRIIHMNFVVHACFAIYCSVSFVYFVFVPTKRNATCSVCMCRWNRRLATMRTQTRHKIIVNNLIWKNGLEMRHAISWDTLNGQIVLIANERNVHRMQIDQSEIAFKMSKQADEPTMQSQMCDNAELVHSCIQQNKSFVWAWGWPML